jgi:pantoate kinase
MITFHIKYSDKMKCTVFAPSHITGFFEIIDHQLPLNRGSRGAGIALDTGVITQVQIIEKSSDNAEVRINGIQDSKNATITFKTLELMYRDFNIGKFLGDRGIRIDHELKVPIGAGYGTSAACALGTALGVAKIFELDITFNKAASMAHLAEIEMKSGLGDVVAEVNGGITFRLKEGAPGIAITDKMILTDDFYVISKSLGGIETSEIIGDPNHKKKINSIGRHMLKELLRNPDPKTFLKLSKRFAMETELLNDEVLDIIKILEDETIGASMAMLGNTAFAISKTPDTTLKNAIVSKIDSNGCRFI